MEPFDLLTRHVNVLTAWVNPYTTRRALHCLTSGTVKVDYMITNRFSIDDAPKAIALMEELPAGFLKALIMPGM